VAGLVHSANRTSDMYKANRSDVHYLRELVAKKLLKVVRIASEYHLADLFTRRAPDSPYYSSFAIQHTVDPG
jgi:hypothetical protein